MKCHLYLYDSKTDHLLMDDQFLVTSLRMSIFLYPQTCVVITTQPRTFPLPQRTSQKITTSGQNSESNLSQCAMTQGNITDRIVPKAQRTS